jgi:hypothetical protein
MTYDFLFVVERQNGTVELLRKLPDGLNAKLLRIGGGSLPIEVHATELTQAEYKAWESRMIAVGHRLVWIAIK